MIVNKILLEATDFKNEYKNNLSDYSKILSLLKEFGITNGFNSNVWNEFVDNNLSTLQTECNNFGLSMENPFFQFLSLYQQKNGSIDIFTDKERYNLLHNLVAQGVIGTKQLTDKAAEDAQIRILWNKNLWSIDNIADISYLIKSYVWVLSNDMNKNIINRYLKLALSEDGDMNNIDSKIKLLKVLYFTDYPVELLNNITRDNDIQNNDNIEKYLTFLKNAINNTPNLISGQFIPVDNIEANFNTLYSDVQESNRDLLTGKKQQSETDSTEAYKNITAAKYQQIKARTSNIKAEIDKQLVSRGINPEDFYNAWVNK